MARIPLRLASWEYDDETKRVVVTFVDMAGVDNSDPVNFQSTMSLEVELLPENAVTKRRITNAQADEIRAEKNTQQIADQLLLSDLETPTA